MRTRLARLVAMVVMVAVLMGVAAPAAFAILTDPYKTFTGDTAKQPTDPYRGSQDFATNVVLFLIRDTG